MSNKAKLTRRQFWNETVSRWFVARWFVVGSHGTEICASGQAVAPFEWGIPLQPITLRDWMLERHRSFEAFFAENLSLPSSFCLISSSQHQPHTIIWPISTSYCA